MLKKWADPSRDRGDEIDAKTLYPDRFQYSSLQCFDDTRWFLYCQGRSSRGELKPAYVTKCSTAVATVQPEEGSTTTFLHHIL